MKDFLEKRVKRGKESWGFIYSIYGILLAAETFIISIIPQSWVIKVVIFIATFFFSTWLCMFNPWFQNKLVGLKTEIEERWRKL